MATTTPDNIQYPVNSDQVAPLASHFKNLADTTQTALNGKASTAAVNAKVAKAGDTMTGALVLSGDPTLALHAATKQYVDTADTALQTQITSNLQTSRMYVKNGSTALTKGTPVYITGANGTNVIVGAASNATEGTSSKVIGLLETDLAINAMGYVVTAGLCTNIDTSGAGAAGDPVWLGVDGAKIYGLSNKPSAPAHLVYLGVVSKKNASTGEIEVRVQNGFELEELHNVQINSGTLATGQALTYDGSTQLWKNSTPVSSLAGLSDVTLTDPEANEVLKYDGTDWVNGTAAGGVTAAATAPDLVAAKQGDAWFDTNDGTLYVCYIDGDSTKQWVQVQANSALEGSILARLGSLESESTVYSAGLTGAVMSFARSSAPTGWLIADGSAISRTTYSELFAAIGTSFGSGNGSTTFAIPDLRGRIPVGKNAATFATLGASGGSETNTLTANNLPAHTHPITDPGHSHQLPRFGGGSSGYGSYVLNASLYNAADQPYNFTPGSGTGITVNNNTTTNSAVNNLQPYQVINYCIKY